ncbi:MAG TPA: hypothetical protein VK604_13955 [Bryobacteraceae bacterium]|nr:hypothetical protein [Bryobacteraceae bacterium]
MEEQTALPLTTESGNTARVAAPQPEPASNIQPLILTPPPIPWEELERRHDANRKVS